MYVDIYKITVTLNADFTNKSGIYPTSETGFLYCAVIAPNLVKDSNGNIGWGETSPQSKELSYSADLQLAFVQNEYIYSLSGLYNITEIK